MSAPPSVTGVEDGSFQAFRRDTLQYTPFCCVNMKGARIQAIRLASIEVDGLDATDKLLEMLADLESDVVILGGVTFAGFNVVDARLVHEETGVPVIVYSGEEPDSPSVLAALRKHFSDWETRWAAIKVLGEVYSTISMEGEPPVYFEVVGCPVPWAVEVLTDAALTCRIPEPVRVAGLVARGVSPSS